jgi:hypothetical protein
MDTSSCGSDKISETNNLKEFLTHDFCGFSPSMVAWLCCFWAVVRQSIMLEGYSRVVHLMAARKEGDSQRKGQGTSYIPQSHTPVTHPPPAILTLQ